MEIISEPCPASWEDGGLNWDSPNPTDFRYFAAIREAILERSLAVDYKLNHTLLREIRPYHALSADQLREVGEQIYSLSQRFLCAQAEDWKPILDCYPIYQQGEYPAGIADGMPLAEGEKWLRSAKEKLDRMRYLYLPYTVQCYSKLANGGTPSSSRECPALEQYNISIAEMHEDWDNRPWSGPSIRYLDMGMESYYQEYYAYYYNNPDWAKGNPYWSKIQVNSVKSRYTPILKSDYLPDISIYAKVVMRNVATVNMFDPSQAFPNDEIVQDKYCRLTNYTRDGETFDFEPAFGRRPLDPPHSMVDYSIKGYWDDIGGVHEIYTSVIRGLWLEDLRLIGDFYSENGFRFKPAKEI